MGIGYSEGLAEGGHKTTTKNLVVREGSKRNWIEGNEKTLGNKVWGRSKHSSKTLLGGDTLFIVILLNIK